MKNFLFILILCAVGVCGMLQSSLAAFDRSLEPVIIKGSAVAEFRDQAIDGVRVYSYSAQTGTWNAIPFQIDEFIWPDYPAGIAKVVWEGDGILTDFDEIVLMAKDAGDKAPDNAAWPEDIESKRKARYEVVIIDPVTFDEGFVYVFYSTTLPTDAAVYVEYKNDYVRTDIYGIGHDTDDANGLPDSLAIVGNNIDFLDSWRIRAYINKIVVKADLGYGLGEVPFEGKNIYFSEDMKTTEIDLKYSWLTVTAKAKAFHDVKALKIKAGPVRVLRESTLGIRLWVEGVSEDTSRIPILTKFYKNTVQFRPAFSLDLGDAVEKIDADYVEFGLALDSDATYMKFYGDGLLNSSGRQDSLIDKDPTAVKFEKAITEDDWPGSLWYGYSGQMFSNVNNASFFQIIDLYDDIITPGNPALTYYDYVNSTLNPNIFGLSALRIYDWSKPPATAFEIESNIRYYYFAENHTRSEFQQLFDKYKNLSGLSLEKHTYLDTIPPGRITDLAVTDRADSSMTISWTARGDDGDTGGPAKIYYIRYSDVEPVDPPGTYDWDWWSVTALRLPSPPKPDPAEPGTRQSVTIEGLDEATTYYFRMNVVDHGGNAGGLSNIASMWTTPVELVSFVGRVTTNNIVRLEWATASESNNLGFDVERRRDDDDWEKIGFVKGAGTTSDEQYYTFEDVPRTSGDWIYRLRQVDTDGASEYSDPISISIAAPQRFELAQNYPNPFNPETTVTFEIPQAADGQMVLTIYDMLGREVRTLINEKAVPGYYNLKWDGADDTGRQTSSGVYIYRLVAGDFTATRKMIKLQ